MTGIGWLSFSVSLIAQVYAVANASGYSVTLSAASMTPQTFAALNTQYGEETS